MPGRTVFRDVTHVFIYFRFLDFFSYAFYDLVCNLDYYLGRRDRRKYYFLKRTAFYAANTEVGETDESAERQTTDERAVTPP